MGGEIKITVTKTFNLADLISELEKRRDRLCQEYLEKCGQKEDLYRCGKSFGRYDEIFKLVEELKRL